MSRKYTAEQRIERALEEFHAYKSSWKREDRALAVAFVLNGKQHTFSEMSCKVEKKRKQIAAKIMKITSEAQP